MKRGLPQKKKSSRWMQEQRGGGKKDGTHEEILRKQPKCQGAGTFHNTEPGRKKRNQSNAPNWTKWGEREVSEKKGGTIVLELGPVERKSVHLSKS